MVRITAVEERSRAQRHGIAPGDYLCSINGHEIRDVLDYRFYLASVRIHLCLRHSAEDGSAGEAYEVLIAKREYDDIGLDFETPLMDKKHHCENKCIFCFIDQLPKGMRKSLYFKDDDSRLSFLHGNFVTLTNLHDEDIDRIIAMHISPVNVSVHTTNPELRVAMMKNKRAGDVLRYLDRFKEAGITVRAQIVLCRGINDGAELDRSMHDLAALFPCIDNVAIVPAGLTKYREKLYPLTLFSPEESAAVIRQVNTFGDECEKKYGDRIFRCADEMYVRAGLPLPGADYYNGYEQIEDGIGMITSMREEFDCEKRLTDEDGALPVARTVSVATGMAAYESLRDMAQNLAASHKGLQVQVFGIVNHFFGETVTVAGLLTGTDISDQLAGKFLGDCLLVPKVALRSGEDCFLDEMTLDTLSQKLNGIRIVPVDNDGAEFLHALLGDEE